MPPISRDSLLTLEAYARQRTEFRAAYWRTRSRAPCSSAPT